MILSTETTPDPWLLVLDESYQGDVLTVGGLMLPQRQVRQATNAWQELKSEMGLPTDAELKYTFANANHPTRVALNAQGLTQAVRVPQMLERVRTIGAKLISNTLVDNRPGETRIVDLYLDAVGRCIRWFANEIQWTIRRPGPHSVLVDQPPTPSEEGAAGFSHRFEDLVENRGTAAFNLYCQRWREAERFGGTAAPRLADLDFSQTLYAAHGKHSDLLQIADVVAGAVRDFCYHNLTNADPRGNLPVPGYRELNFRIVAPAFRRSWRQGILGGGFAVFPVNETAVVRLQERAAQIASVA